jgi:hypothetical protein
MLGGTGMAARNFFSELKRRHVYKVPVAYAVVAWLPIQDATRVFPFFELPNWTVRPVVLLLALGFPIALGLAWAFELTPEDPFSAPLRSDPRFAMLANSQP